MGFQGAFPVLVFFQSAEVDKADAAFAYSTSNYRGDIGAVYRAWGSGFGCVWSMG